MGTVGATIVAASLSALCRELERTLPPSDEALFRRTIIEASDDQPMGGVGQGNMGFPVDEI